MNNVQPLAENIAHSVARYKSLSPDNDFIKKLSIVIPCFNEMNSIDDILHKVIAVSLPYSIEKEILVVDDCSKDGTFLKIQEFIDNNPDSPIIRIQHKENLGKGAAIRTGIQLATGDYLLIQDADLEYDPREYNVLLRPILDGHADVVYGSRFMGGSAHRILFFWHSIGNRLLTLLSNAFTNLNLTDMETGYKLFRTDILQKLPLRENRFGFEPEVTAKIAQVPNIRLYEVGISYYGRTYKEGKKIKWRDGLRTVYCIFKYSLLDRMRTATIFQNKMPSTIIHSNTSI